jgi:hypothetical protein
MALGHHIYVLRRDGGLILCPPCPVQAKKPPKPDDSDETHWYVALSSYTSYTQRRAV